MPQNKPLFAVFVASALLGCCLAWAGLPYRQFLPVTLASSDLAMGMALADLPPGGEPLLMLDCLFALGYAFVLSAAARELAPFSASPATGGMLARLIWLGAAADIAENAMLMLLLRDPLSVNAALLRPAAVVKFALFIAACGWVGGAAWRAERKSWSAAAIIAAGVALAGVLPALLGSGSP